MLQTNEQGGSLLLTRQLPAWLDDHTRHQRHALCYQPGRCARQLTNFDVSDAQCICLALVLTFSVFDFCRRSWRKPCSSCRLLCPSLVKFPCRTHYILARISCFFDTRVSAWVSIDSNFTYQSVDGHQCGMQASVCRMQQTRFWQP